MNLKELFSDKTTKPKEKIEIVSQYILQNPAETTTVIAFAQNSKDAIKASCIEAFEFASRENNAAATENWIQFAIENLSEKAPRIKWESAKVIGNLAVKFPKLAEKAIPGLLSNTENDGTVVRWASAFALGEIVKLKLPINTELIPTLEKIIEQEEKNSIKKIYQTALKKIAVK